MKALWRNLRSANRNDADLLDPSSVKTKNDKSLTATATSSSSAYTVNSSSSILNNNNNNNTHNEGSNNNINHNRTSSIGGEGRSRSQSLSTAQGSKSMLSVNGSLSILSSSETFNNSKLQEDDSNHYDNKASIMDLQLSTSGAHTPGAHSSSLSCGETRSSPNVLVHVKELNSNNDQYISSSSLGSTQTPSSLAVTSPPLLSSPTVSTSSTASTSNTPTTPSRRASISNAFKRLSFRRPSQQQLNNSHTNGVSVFVCCEEEGKLGVLEPMIWC